MITLEGDCLKFSFPEVDADATCAIHFQRTLRLPDDGKTYPLPAGLGRFSLHHADDFASRLPPALVGRGGVVMPMWQAEAMWISFGSPTGYPCAVKIAAGKINAVTGASWTNGLHRGPQDYVVATLQPWLDGFCVEKGVIRQFVAAPLGDGITAEEQLTGAAEYGGIQIIVYPMKKAARGRLMARRRAMYRAEAAMRPCAAAPMGLAAGGQMRQEIYEDHHDFDVWDLSVSSRCFVTILNAAGWHAVTGEAPPSTPISAEDYRRHGIPWFDYYAADQAALPGSSRLAGLKSIKDFVQFGWARAPKPVAQTVIHLGPDVRPQRTSATVREGDL
jgi:hypothetical protein